MMDYWAWEASNFLIDVVGALTIAIVDQIIFVILMIALQVTHGLPPWAWGGFAGHLIGCTVREFKILRRTPLRNAELGPEATDAAKTKTPTVP